MSCTQCYDWFKRFADGRLSIGDESKSERPSMSVHDDHVDRVRAMIRGNRHLTDREVTDER